MENADRGSTVGGVTASDRSMRLLFLNAFLVPPVNLGVAKWKVPAFDPGAVDERRAELGAFLSGEYDIIALAEVFRPSDLDALAERWHAVGNRPTAVVHGPERARGTVHGSGLATLIGGMQVQQIAKHEFRHRGSLLDGADRLANKGALMVNLEARSGRTLQLVSTHLHAGGWITDSPQANADRIREQQIDELVGFITAERVPGATLLVCGDFNVPAVVEGDFGRAHDEHLREAMARLDLVDAWDDLGTGAGWTANLKAAPEAFPPDRADDRFCRDPAPVSGPSVSRIDRWFVPVRGTSDTTATLLRRRALPRPLTAPGREHIRHISDHVGLHLEITL